MASAMNIRTQAETAAAEWIVRRARDDWSKSDEAELQRWIVESLDHRVAWLRLDAAWQETQRLKSLLSSAPAGNVPRPEELRLPFYDDAVGQPVAADTNVAAPGPDTLLSRWTARRLTTAAAACVVMLSTVIGWQLLRTPSYHTEVGAMQAVPLPDGSRMTLNTNTKLQVDVTPTERRVILSRGEAFFEVAKDPTRPFVVMAGDRRVVAVGTQFSVRREGNELRVLVTEGMVRLENSTSPAATSQSAGSARPDQRMLTAGTIARADADAVLVREQTVGQVEQLLSWRNGYLVFDNTPLSEAVAEFNRYNERQVVIEDPQVAEIAVGGNFRATNVDAFVRLIATDNSITAKEEDDKIILSTGPSS
jgi:transmembrane sensor